ncbi:MAG: carboxypeptidase regulatory-like domain-containing protein [Gemmatimonadales bacterium]
MNLSRLHHVGAILAASLASTPAVAQETQLTGRVIDERTSDGVAGARVLLVETPRIESTGQDGSYLFRGMTPGAHQVRVVAIGFTAQVKPVTVSAGQTDTLDFTMTAQGTGVLAVSDRSPSRRPAAPDPAALRPSGRYRVSDRTLLQRRSDVR